MKRSTGSQTAPHIAPYKRPSGSAFLFTAAISTRICGSGGCSDRSPLGCRRRAIYKMDRARRHFSHASLAGDRDETEKKEGEESDEAVPKIGGYDRLGEEHLLDVGRFDLIMMDKPRCPCLADRLGSLGQGHVTTRFAEENGNGNRERSVGTRELGRWSWLISEQRQY